MASVVPGLYVALIAVLLHAFLRKWFDAVPSRVILLHAVLILAILGPHLFLGGSLVPISNLRESTAFPNLPDTSSHENRLRWDLLDLFVPTLKVIREQIASGEMPLRDDSVAGGIPLWADPQSRLIQPISVLSLPFDSETALVVQSAIRFVLVLTFSWLFFFRRSRSVVAAAAGSVAYGMGGFVQAFMPWPHASTAAWLLAVLYAIDRVVEDGKPRDSLLLIGASFGLLTTGHPETIVFAALLASVYGAWAVVRAMSRDRRAAFLRISAAVVVGGLLTAPVNLPALFVLDSSERAIMLQFMNSTLQPPATRTSLLVSMIAPETFGNDRYGDYKGFSNSAEDGGAYPGAAAWMLVILLAVTPGRSAQARFAAAVATTCAAIVVAPVPLDTIVASLPVMNRTTTGGVRLVMILNLMLAWLAVEAIARLDARPPRRLAVVPLATLFAALLVTTCSLANGVPFVDGRRAGILIAQLVAVAFVAWAVSSSKRMWTMPLLVCVAAGELLVTQWVSNPATPARMPPAPPALERLVAEGPGTLVRASRKSLHPNIASFYDLRAVDAYNPVQPFGWYLLTFTIRDASYDDPRPGAERWLDVLAVTHVLRPSRGVSGENIIFDDGETELVRRPTTRAPYRFATAVSPHPEGSLPSLLLLPPREASRAIVARALSFGGEAGDWMLRDAPPAGVEWVADTSVWSERMAARSEDMVEVLSSSPTRVRLRTRADGPRLLVTTLPDDGGWTVHADGGQLETTRVNGAFVGFAVPDGVTDVKLVYRPRGLMAGFALGLFGLLLAPAAISRNWDSQKETRDD